MTTVEELLGELRSARHATLARFAELPQEQITTAFPWRGAMADVRHALNWLSEGDDAARTYVVDALHGFDRPVSVAQQAMVLAGEVRGRLLGMLVGLPKPQFDAPPAEGEWPVREALGHVIANDKRYAIAVRYAVERARTGGTGPLRPPDSSLPSRVAPAASAGTVVEVLERVQTTGDEVAKELGAVPDALLDAPTNWVRWDLDVRFRLHRFAAHLREHAIQVRQTLDALGFHQTEPQLWLAEATVSRAALETLLLCIPDHLLGAALPGGGSMLDAVGARLADEQALVVV